MGFLDDIMGNDKENTTSSEGIGRSANPLEVSMFFTPLRLSANRSNSIDLVVKVRNLSNENQLVSIDVALPRNCMLGFDPSCINKTAEKQAGELKPGESTTVAIPVWANNQSKGGTYELGITTYHHYRHYDKVMGSLKRSLSLRVA
ncbi:MAG: hypothetical protein ACP5N9_02640 [Candidatus Bilamarchaeum sp.]|jgi:uncharacterized membrane protein